MPTNGVQAVKTQGKNDSPVPAVREPLSAEELWKLREKCPSIREGRTVDVFINAVRLTEQIHGITGAQGGNEKPV